MGRSFLPEFNEGTLTISAVTLPGTSLAQSDELGRSLEKILLSVPEVVATARRTGRTELDEHVQGVESAELDVNLKMQNRSKQQVLEDIRRRASILPGMNVTIGQPISHRIDHMLSGTRANIAVKIFGDDLAALRALAKQVEAVVQTVPGAVDVSTEQQMEIPTVRVTYDRPALARYGLGAGAAAQALQTAFVGQQVGEILEGQVSFPLVVRYDAGEIRDLETIRQTQIDTPSGARIPLAAVADIREDRGPNFISRENVQRKIVVQCNVAGRDLRGLVNDIERRVQAQVPLPSGYHIEYGGQFESEARASAAAAVAWLGRDRRHLRYPDHGISFIARRLDHHAQSAPGADRRSDRSLRRRWSAVGGLHHRLHHAVRHRHAQRHHAGFSRQAPDERGGRRRTSGRRFAGAPPSVLRPSS